jgi:hypothetical protein
MTDKKKKSKEWEKTKLSGTLKQWSQEMRLFEIINNWKQVLAFTDDCYNVEDLGWTWKNEIEWNVFLFIVP